MKGQLTVFIIIGLLVLISFAVTIYVGNLMRQPLKTDQEEQLRQQPLTEYVTSCLTLTATNALALIGKQGGVLYKYQGGITPAKQSTDDYFTYQDPEHGQLNISYIILPPTGTVGTLFYSTPPEYPFETFPYLPNGSLYFDGYYGINNLPPLYKTHPETNKTVTNSIQETLETYISTNTATCADFASFTDNGYTISTGTPAASLIFATKQQQFKGEQTLTIALAWPINVTSPDNSITHYDTFTTKVPVRLATIYYTVKALVDADVTNINYTPVTTSAFTIEKTTHQEDSIIVVKDAQSIANDEPFEFWVPRKNRRPALWHLDTPRLTLHVAETRGTELSVQGNTLVINDPCPANGPQRLRLDASDPDEDDITYELSIPLTTTNTIPSDAAGVPNYKITIYATDRANHTLDWFDHQSIPTTVSPCVE